MNCPICNKIIRSGDKFCPTCGAFLKGRRPGSGNAETQRVDINNDSLEYVERLPGLSRERAVALVRERMNRSGFMNLAEAMDYIGLNGGEKKELGARAVCLPMGAEPSKDASPLPPPDEWSELLKRNEAPRKKAAASQSALTENIEKKSKAAAKVDINNASESEIAALPALNVVIAKNIVSERASRGGFNSIDELAKAVKLKQFMADLIAPMIEFKPMKQVPRRKRRGRVVDY